MRRKLIAPAVLAAVLLSASSAWAPPPAAEIDPIVALQLDADEAAAERLLLNEALGLVRDKNYAFAVARLAPLTTSRFLPAAVAQSIPGLIEDLRRLDAVTRLVAIEKMPVGKFPAVSADSLPTAIKRPLLWIELLRAVDDLLETRLPDGTKLPWTAAQANKLLGAVADEFGAEAAGKLRTELSAKLFSSASRRTRTIFSKGKRRTNTRARFSPTCGRSSSAVGRS